ncbi:MAG: HAD family phosphatase [Holdemanella sp.]|nr:HAD family phosphatase [Holdemanella sp.]
MEDIKMVLVDIDGTLLTDKKTVTEKTKDAISKLKDKHIPFGIATGRTPYAVRHLIKDWGIHDSVSLIMGFNGGCYLDLKTGYIQSCYLLEKGVINKVRNDFKGFDFAQVVYDKESVHTDKDNPLTRNIALNNNIPFFYDDLQTYNEQEIEKILIVGEEKEIDALLAYYENNISTTSYKLARSNRHLVECINPELSKSKGIQILCDAYNIKMENVLTFGDEINDYEMIRDCIGVAMGNANPTIKEAAKYITDTNNDDGIAKFLEQYIL